jgi:hypothetical protein
MWGRGTEKIRAVETGFGPGEVGDNEDMRSRTHDYKLDI